LRLKLQEFKFIRKNSKNIFFQLNPPLRVGEIVFDDEIRLDGGWVDLVYHFA